MAISWATIGCFSSIFLNMPRYPLLFSPVFYVPETKIYIKDNKWFLFLFFFKNNYSSSNSNKYFKFTVLSLCFSFIFLPTKLNMVWLSWAKVRPRGDASGALFHDPSNVMSYCAVKVNNYYSSWWRSSIVGSQIWYFIQCLLHTSYPFWDYCREWEWDQGEKMVVSYG